MTLMGGEHVTRAEFMQLQGHVKDYMLSMRGEILDAVKRQDQRIDGLYGLNIKDMRVRIESLETSVATIAPPGLDKERIGGLEVEFIGLQNKLNQHDHELQNVILETRGAVERLAHFEATFQATSEKNFEGIRHELSETEHNVKGITKTIGQDKRAELSLDAPNSIFDKVNWLYTKVEEVGAKQEKCHCDHVEKLLDELERYKAMARTGHLGHAGGAGE